MLVSGLEDGKRFSDVLEKVGLRTSLFRSICPGKDIASNNAFVILASILATIEIVPALDKDGKPIPVNAERPLRTLS